MGGEIDLDEHLRWLLTGSLDTSGFRQWFASALWAIESKADEDTIEFASLVENRIAEYARGHVPDQVLLATLRADVAARTGSG
ncbi:MAG: hypothetical protein M3464_19525 [Chloroflexota bacterium]|nr:hypothetical protein [Chloroflexota bacterium]